MFIPMLNFINMIFSMKQSYVGLAIAMFCGIYYWNFQIIIENDNLNQKTTLHQTTSSDEFTHGVLLWWTNSYEHTALHCDKKELKILVTSNRTFLTHPRLKAILFYGSNIDHWDLPLPRNPTIPWALLHDESPKNVPFLSQSHGIALFNLTSTFSRYSSFPLSPLFLQDIAELTDSSRRYTIPLATKNELQTTHQLAPIVFVQSICDTMTDRDGYVQELMNYIQVDAYGKCLHNKDMPQELSGDNYISTIDMPEFYEFLARYKFVIAFENSACDDYVTEKLWRPLMVGVLPIYFGAPNVKLWLPHSKSAILVSDFETPAHLAEFIRYLNDDDEAYTAYTSAESNNSTINDFLLRAIHDRNNRSSSHGFFRDFECSVALHHAPCLPSIADESHYDCRYSDQRFAATGAAPTETTSNIPTHKHYTNWQMIWRQGACEAELLDELIRGNVSFTKHVFHSLIFAKYKSGDCT